MLPGQTTPSEQLENCPEIGLKLTQKEGQIRKDGLRKDAIPQTVSQARRPLVRRVCVASILGEMVVPFEGSEIAPPTLASPRTRTLRADATGRATARRNQ